MMYLFFLNVQGLVHIKPFSILFQESETDAEKYDMDQLLRHDKLRSDIDAKWEENAFLFKSVNSFLQ